MERLYTKKRLNVGSSYMLGIIVDSVYNGYYWIVTIEYNSIPNKIFRVYQV